MRHIAVAVPAGMSCPALGFHIIDTARLHKLLVELLVATDTVVHDDLIRHCLSLNGLTLTTRDEVSHMLHTVEAFKAIVRQEVAVRHMTVVARRVTSMGGVAPCGIVRRHDVAVDAGCWIVPNDVGMHAQQVHEKRYEPR